MNKALVRIKPLENPVRRDAFILSNWSVLSRTRDEQYIKEIHLSVLARALDK